MSAFNSPEELRGLLMRALETPLGLILNFDGSDSSQRQSALAALLTAKRELQPDEPQMLNLRIKPHPTDSTKIVIQKIQEL